MFLLKKHLKTKILYIVQFYSGSNEPGGQGYRHYKHAHALAREGHSVTLITSGSTTMSMDSHQQFGQQTEDRHPNLEIIKIHCPPILKRSVFFRAVSYFRFSFLALLTGLNVSFRNQYSFHYVLGSSPPLIIGFVAYILSLINHADLYLEVRDLWSQTMASNGFIKNHRLIQMNRILECFLYRVSKKIITLSQAFNDEIEKQTPGSARKTHFIPNGADMELFERKQKEPIFHSEQQPSYHVVYAGVFSDYTHLETLLETAKLLAIEPAIKIHLVGGGYDYQKLHLQAEKENINNVIFWSTIPKKMVSQFLMESNLSIICYRNLEIYGKVLPNKLFDYLAAGRPILACAPEGEISKILIDSNAGKTVEPEAPEKIAEEVLWFYQNQDQGRLMGLRGRSYVKKQYNRTELIKRLIELFPSHINQGSKVLKKPKKLLKIPMTKFYLF